MNGIPIKIIEKIKKNPNHESIAYHARLLRQVHPFSVTTAISLRDFIVVTEMSVLEKILNIDYGVKGNEIIR